MLRTIVAAFSLSCALATGYATNAPQLPSNTAQDFEVASIKPCASDVGLRGREPAAPGRLRPGGFRTTPDTLILPCKTLVEMMSIAFITFGGELPIDNNTINRPTSVVPIGGGPAWVNSDLYLIEAKAAGTPSEATMAGPMLRNLLESRFQLRIHRQNEEVPAYVLAVAKGGLKLRPTQASPCRQPDSIDPFAQPAAGQPALPRCTFCFCSAGNATTATLDTDYMSTRELSEELSFWALGRPVIDKTGAKGRFKIDLEFTPDETTPAWGEDTQKPSTTPSNTGPPTIFTALEQQLGLKLAPTKAPRAFIVIDHVERPSEN